MVLLRRSIALALRMHSFESTFTKSAFYYSADYDTSHPIETRKYLKTYGLTPPGVDTFETQAKRCEVKVPETLDPTDPSRYGYIELEKQRH